MPHILIEMWQDACAPDGWEEAIRRRRKYRDILGRIDDTDVKWRAKKQANEILAIEKRMIKWGRRSARRDWNKKQVQKWSSTIWNFIALVGAVFKRWLHSSSLEWQKNWPEKKSGAENEPTFVCSRRNTMRKDQNYGQLISHFSSTTTKLMPPRSRLDVT